MQPQQYCVYNQTNECFLSLGARIGDNVLTRLLRVFGLGYQRVDEGCWIAPLKSLPALGIFSSRDLVYIDDSDKVVDVVESFPAYRTVPPRSDSASLLALPVHTICSSQTRPGNQLLICAPDELEVRLQSVPDQRREALAPKPACKDLRASKKGLPRGVSADRRSTARTACQCPAAYYSEDGALAVHVIRNVSASGLYVITKERWPVGAEVKMSLQRTDGHDDSSAKHPVTVQMRVARWGADGVGLEFSGPGVDQGELLAMHVC